MVEPRGLQRQVQRGGDVQAMRAVGVGSDHDAKSRMAGKASRTSPPMRFLTLPHDRIAQCRLETRHQIPTQSATEPSLRCQETSILSGSRSLNIVIPMAGLGSRFAQAGYSTPKPLIQLGGIPMIAWVIDNVRPVRSHHFIFLCLKEHLEYYPEFEGTLKELCPGCDIIMVKRVTAGAASTVLLARDLIDSQSPLMIANSDQYAELNINEYLATGDRLDVDGIIMTFWSDHPKWSYCRMQPGGLVSEVVEKEVVSNEATVGIYNFRHGSDFVRAADAMIAQNLRVNGEFYVAPTYNHLIRQGAGIIAISTGRDRDGMYGLGVPEDLEFFKTTEVFQRVSHWHMRRLAPNR